MFLILLAYVGGVPVRLNPCILRCRSCLESGVKDHTFRIEFLAPGMQAYSFTFG
jgi:hypothetical protein